MPDVRLAALSKTMARSFVVVERDESLEDAVYFGNGGDVRALCSRCDRVIGEDLGGVPYLQDTAVVCPNCRVHLRLDKASPYSGWLPMLRDVRSSSPDPVEIPEAKYGRWHKHGLAEATEAALAQLVAHQSAAPAVLHHYTSREGLVGIIRSGTLWASDIAYMNDASEAKYGQDLLRELISLGGGGASGLARQLIDSATAQSGPSFLAASQHIVCFCEEEDLLSQWRSYGTDGGCSLAFWTDALRPHTLRRMIYDRGQQVEIICKILEIALTQLGGQAATDARSSSYADPELLTLTDWLSEMLTAALLSFKHSAFAEEREWRLIDPVHRRRDMGRVLFRQSRGVIVPYTAVRPNEHLSVAPPLPIVSVTCGPSAHPELASKSVELLLQKHEYDHVEVLSTSAPLRV